MNEQFAFAIAFDQQQTDLNSHGESASADWPKLITQIEQKLQSEGFFSLDHPRWEEFGEGRIFWGTRLECETLRSLLSSLPVQLYEERNLDAGYYTSEQGLYYVKSDGEILGLEKSDQGAINGALPVVLDTIPMEAYKTSEISTEVELRFQQVIDNQASEQSVSITPELESLSIPENEIATGDQPPIHDEVVVEAEAVTDDNNSASVDELESLRQQSEAYAQEIQSFTQTVDQQKSQIYDLRLMLDRKVEPEIHAELQQQATAQADQVREQEQELSQLRQINSELLAAESQRVSAEEYERLGQVSNEQGQTITALEVEVQQLQQEKDGLAQSAMDLEAQVVGLRADSQRLELVVKQKEAEESSAAQQLQSLRQENESRAQAVKNLDAQIAHLRSEHQQLAVQAEMKVDPRDHEIVQERAETLTQQVQALEQEKLQLTAEVKKWRETASFKVERVTYDALLSKSQAQAQQLTMMKNNAGDLTKKLTEWKRVADSKVAKSDYDEALAQVQRMQAKLSRSWFQRLKDWLQGK